jgi:hypothetical protein
MRRRARSVRRPDRGRRVPPRGGEREDRLLILPTTRLANLLGERLLDPSEPSVAARLLNELWGQFEQMLTDGLDRALGRLLDTEELIAKDVELEVLRLMSCGRSVDARDRYDVIEGRGLSSVLESATRRVSRLWQESAIF